MFLVNKTQDEQQQVVGRNALHALMGLEATPIKAGGFKYLHRDTGLMFEIAPATPDSAGAVEFACTDCTCAQKTFVYIILSLIQSHGSQKGSVPSCIVLTNGLFW